MYKHRFMQSSLLVLVGLLMALPTRADVLLTEDFSSGTLPATWSTTAIQNIAVWVVQNAPALGSPSGTFYAVFDDDALGAATTPNEAFIATPVIDCSNRTAVYVQYYHHWFGVEFTYGYVEVSNNGGTTWNTVVTYQKNTRGTLAAPQDTVLNISAWAANQNNVQVRWRYNDGGQAGKFWYLDNVTVFADPDVGISDVIAPDYLGCAASYNGAEAVTVAITNYGIYPVSGIPVTVNVTDGATQTLTGTYVGSIPGQTTVNYILPGTVNMVPDDAYQFECYTTLPTDEYLYNDTFVDSRHQLITTFPFLEDFNANNGGWQAVSVVADNEWEWGTVPATYLGGAAGNGKAWRLQRDGTTTYSDQWLISPPFDLTGLVNPKLSMDIQYDLAYDWCDRGVYVQYSTNNGTNWNTLGSNADPTWYSSGTNTCWPNTWSAGTVSN